MPAAVAAVGMVVEVAPVVGTAAAVVEGLPIPTPTFAAR
jgi:hypothetical protein